MLNGCAFLHHANARGNGALLFKSTIPLGIQNNVWGVFEHIGSKL